MHRIDGPTAAPALPAPGAVVGTPGYFSDGDPLTATPPTTVTPAWANAVQEEFATVIEEAGLTLDKGNNGQLLAALQALFGSGVNPDAQTLVIGSWIIKRGSHRSAVSSETTATITYTTPFPTATDQVLPVVAISTAGVTYNLWAQRVDGSTDRNGFTIQYQGVTTDLGAAGFDWIAIGH